GIQHLPATRHARPDSRQYTGKPLQAARGLQPRKRCWCETPHFVAPCIEQVTAEVKAQRRFLLAQTRLEVPWRHLGQFQLHDIARVVGKERNLIGAALELLGCLNRIAHRCEQCCTVLGNGIKGAGADQRLDGPAIDGGTVHPLTEVERRSEETTSELTS